jgi:hypothetical protein
MPRRSLFLKNTVRRQTLAVNNVMMLAPFLKLHMLGYTFIVNMFFIPGCWYVSIIFLPCENMLQLLERYCVAPVAFKITRWETMLVELRIAPDVDTLVCFSHVVENREDYGDYYECSPEDLLSCHRECGACGLSSEGMELVADISAT